MKLYKAQVVDSRDPLEEGKFHAYIKEYSEYPVKVTLTSPYYVPGVAGFLAVPAKGAEVLVAKAEGSDEFFLMTNVVTPGEGRWKGGSDQSPTVFRDLYDADGQPRRLVWQTVLGHSMVFSEKIDENGQDIKIEIKTAKGKRFLLSDSPDTNFIALINEEGDGLKVTTDEVGTIPSRSIELETKGSIREISREGQIDLLVQDGREINILNRSTGTQAPEGSPEKVGNVNVESENNDVNLTVRADDGRIFLKALGNDSEIQIDSKGIMTISSAKKLSIVSEEGIHLKGSEVAIEADGNIDILAGAQLRVGGSVVQAKSDGDLALDGATVNLNSGIAQKPNNSQPNQANINNYED